ncbi:MAG: cupin domain-containing protein [Acidobacteriota bacterium]
MDKVNIDEKLSRIKEHFHPYLIAELNGQEIKAVKALGEFVWHHHEDADELFLIVRGRLRIEFRDHHVELGPGEMLVIPRGLEHRPVAEEEVELLLFEPRGTVNTGNIESDPTVAQVDRI